VKNGVKISSRWSLHIQLSLFSFHKTKKPTNLTDIKRSNMKTAFVIALANLSSSSLAFSPNSICSSYTSDRSSTKLHSFALDNDVDAVYLLAKADECAHSETCSIDDAEHYLNELVHIQGNCASGQLQSSAVCEDIQYPSEIMASLRYKIENKIYK
jgi:hypothetical protein